MGRLIEIFLALFFHFKPEETYQAREKQRKKEQEEALKKLNKGK